MKTSIKKIESSVKEPLELCSKHTNQKIQKNSTQLKK